MIRDVPLRGPVYDLMGLRLQDVEAGCPTCGKLLAVVIDDIDRQWNRDDIICVDCGRKASLPPYLVKPSTKAPGRRVAVCQLCPYVSMPTDGLKAAEWAVQHYQAVHAGDAA